MDWWPASLDSYRLPDSLALTVALFSILVWCVSHIPVVRSIAGLSDHFFESPDRTIARIWPLPAFSCWERWLAASMVTFLVVINQFEVAIDVRLSFVGRDFFTALQSKDSATFWRLLLTVFPFWITILIAATVIEIVVQAMLTIRWRRYLTNFFLSRWLNGSTHYRISLLGGGTDNPDQRISEDVNRFIDGGGFGGGVQSGYGVYSFTIQLISTMSSLVSYSIILWTLSAEFTVPGTNYAVPGFLFWVALIYATIGTLLAHMVGRALAGLQFMHQRYEADFRFSLSRLREYSEAGLDSLKLQLFSDAPIYDDLETVQLADSLGMMAEEMGEENEIVQMVLAGKSPRDRAAELIHGTALKDVAVRKRLAEGGLKAIQDSNDPLIQLARQIDPESRRIRQVFEQQVDEPQRQAYGKIANARFAVYGSSVYPDATFTLRLAFGEAKGYAEGGEKIPWATTLGGTYEHAAAHNNKDPFELPKLWNERKSQLNLSTPFNFVSTADIIGGNSGSPVINRQGELVGIIFDGNIESLILDYTYTDKVARAVAVHSAGILEALRKAYLANRLVTELTGKK